MLEKNKSKGFTLIELSIVIVIIGLIVASVVGGQSLVRQAKIRSIISEYNEVKIALNAFKLEYDALPGDMNNAVAYGIGANNGNGDNNLEIYNTESVYFWSHLTNADIYPGSYGGTWPDIPYSGYGGGVRLHVSYIKLGGLGSNWINSGTQDLFGVIDDVNVISFAKMVGSSGAVSSPFLRVSEAYGIDDKIDDGLADSGLMYSANEGNTNTDGNRCVDNAMAANGGASYDFDEEGENCRIIFSLGR